MLRLINNIWRHVESSSVSTKKHRVILFQAASGEYLRICAIFRKNQFFTFRICLETTFVTIPKVLRVVNNIAFVIKLLIHVEESSRIFNRNSELSTDWHRRRLFAT